MARTSLFARLLALGAATGLVGCQSAPPMSKARFVEAAGSCALKATTYTYRDGYFVDEPLVDFSRELNPAKAVRCFDDALGQIDRRMTVRGAEHIGYIWEVRA